jgi:hypothetical protein
MPTYQSLTSRSWPPASVRTVFDVRRPDDFGEIDKALAVTDGPAVVNVRINGAVELAASWEIAQHLG